MQFWHKGWIASVFSGAKPEGAIKIRRGISPQIALPRLRAAPNRHLPPSNPLSALLALFFPCWRWFYGELRSRTVRQRPREDGLTVYQLLVSIIVVVIIGALWGAYNQHQQTKQQQSFHALSLNG